MLEDPRHHHSFSTGASGDGASASQDFNDAFPAGLDPWSSLQLPDGAGWGYVANWGVAAQAAPSVACTEAPALGASDSAGGLQPALLAGSLQSVAAQPIIDGALIPGASGGATTDSLVGSSGSSALLADQLRNDFGVTGAGIKIGVLSDSFNDLGGAATDEADGALPSTVSVLQDLSSGGTDEGRAMLELVHQIAPGAQLDFATAYGGEANFAANIEALRNAGCNIIIDDVSSPDEPFFQPSVISQAIDSVVASGAMYFTAAGNNAANAYQSVWRGTDNDTFFDFNSGSGAAVTTQTISVTFSPGDPVNFDLQWAQPFNSPQSNFQLELTDQYGQSFFADGGPNFSGDTADALIQLEGSGTFTFDVSIEKLSGPDPSELKYVVDGDGLPVSINGSNTGTVTGHAEDPNAISVAAANSSTPGQIEPFSSSGAGTEWLFSANGTPLSSPITPSKVSLTSVDGITTTVPGNLSYFEGTSAAAPTAAAVAALLMQLDPTAGPALIEQALEATATNEGVSSSLQGAGLVNALAAADYLVVPTVSVSTASLTVAHGHTVDVSTLFSASDNGSEAITQYTVELRSTTGGEPDGSISQNGVALTPFQDNVVSTLTGLTYAGGATPGTDNLWVRASDGASWSSWGVVHFTDAGDTPPVVTVTQTTETVAAGQQVSVSSLFSASDPDGDSITQYTVELRSTAGANPFGSISQNGVGLTPFQDNIVSTLTGLTYTGSTTAGADNLWVRASDGTSWSSWVDVSFTDTGGGGGGGGGGSGGSNTPPVMTTTQTTETVAANQQVSISTLFSASDPDGDSITQYTVELRSVTGTDPFGSISQNGVELTPFQDNIVSTLTGITYTGSTTAGADNLWVRASDGTNWSSWVDVRFTDTGGASGGGGGGGGGSGGSNTPPVMTTTQTTETVAANQQVSIASLFSASDPDGDSITQYTVELRSVTGTDPFGSISQNGVELTPFQDNIVSTLTGITYTGSTTAGADNLWVRASDGTNWSSWVDVRFTDTGGASGGGGGGGGGSGGSNTPPVMTTTQTTETVAANQQVSIASLFSASDPDGDSITQYTVELRSVTGTDPFGSISQNGVELTPFQDNIVSTLTGITYTGSTTAGADNLWVRASDGTNWSSWVDVRFTDTGGASGGGGGGGGSGGSNTPPVMTTTQTTETVAANQQVSISTLFSASDPDGDSITQYTVELRSVTGGDPVGSISQNGTALTPFQDNIVSTLAGITYTGGATAGADNLWVRASDGTNWSSWVDVRFTDVGNTPPVVTTTQTSETVAANQQVSISTLFSASDPDGDAITQYTVELRSTTGGDPDGSISQNGTALTPFQDNIVSTLAGITYTGGAAAGADNLWVRASDGTSWSSWVDVTFTDTGGGGSGGTVGGGPTPPVPPPPAPPSASEAGPTQSGVQQLVQAMASFSTGSTSVGSSVAPPPDPTPSPLIAASTQHQ